MTEFQVVSDGVAVYAYREAELGLEFLQLRRTDDEELLPDSWQVVYGGREGDELAAETARRELLEETGLVAEKMYLIEFVETFFFRPRNSIMMLPVFAAKIARDARVVLNHEHDEFRWVSQAEIASKFVWRSQREALRVVLETINAQGTELHLLEV